VAQPNGLAAPVGLAAWVIPVETSSTAVALVWDLPSAGSNLSSYVIDVGSRSGLSDIGSVSIPVGDASFIANPVRPGTYYMRVLGVSGGTVSAPSNEVMVIAKPPQAFSPDTPNVGGRADVSDSTVSLVWSPNFFSAPASSYVVRVGSWPGMEDVADVDVGPITALTVPNVPDGKYYVRILGRNAAGTQFDNSNGNGVIVSGPCKFVVGTTIDSLSRLGGVLDGFLVRTSNPSCQWTAEKNRPWFDMWDSDLKPITGLARTGSASFSVSSGPNFGTNRVGLVRVKAGGQELDIFVFQTNFFR